MTPPHGSGSQRPVRTLLIWLVLACLLPGLLGAVTLFIYQYREGRDQLENNTLQAARALIHGVDSHLLKIQAVAQALAASDALARNDLASFHRQARAAIAQIGLGTNVVLRDKEGRQVLNTVVEFGRPLPDFRAPEQVRGVFATGQPTISDVFIGPALKRPIMSVDVPVRIDGRVAYALGIGILPEQFNSIIKAQGLPPDRVTGVFDRQGTIFGRSHAPEQFVGRPAAPELLERMKVSPEGSLQAKTSDGIRVLVFHTRSPDTGWQAAIGIPRRNLQMALALPLAMLATGVGGLFGIGILLARMMGNRIARSVSALIEPAEALGSGGSAPAPRADFQEAAELAQAIDRAADLLKERSASLQESQEKLELFIRYAPAALAMFDREMRYLAVSRRWMEDYGLGDMEILGKSHYEVFPDIPERWKAIHRRGLAGEVIRADEDSFHREDGSTQWVRWELRPWHMTDGSVGGIVIFSEDITPYKDAQEEIRRLNADLERRVAERTAELTAANRELDSFAYAVSHDLRAPLRAMSGFSRILEESCAGRLDGEAPRYLQEIRQASRKMSDLIDGILALSRVTRGEMRRDRIDLSALAEHELEELAAADPGRQVKWAVEPGLEAQGDARLMESVMGNLLGNAWKYTARTPDASIRVYRDGDGFCIADNGAGFDPRYAEKLFQPFQRLHRQEEFPGIGIGLATVQRIIQRHGGEITATGSPGRGAVFRFSLGTTPPARH